MRKYLAAAVALSLVATLLCGCRGNVSNRDDGIITDPTGTAATMPGTDTTPGMNTTPSVTTEPSASTRPSETTHPNASEGTNATEGTTDTTEGTQGNARTRRPMDAK